MQEELTAPVSARTRLRLGELLLTEGLVTEDQLMLALDEQKRSGERLGRILVSNRIITESQLVRALAKHYAIDFLDLDESLVDPGASRMIKESFARRYQALGVGWEDDRLIVAMANPSDVLALDDIRSLTGAELKPVMAEPGQLNRAIEKAWRSASEAEAMLRLTSDVDADDDVMANVKEAAEDAPVIQFVNELIIRAVHDRASDIHLEPGEVELRVRFRIDGVLQDVMQVPRSIQNAVISRLKIMGDLNIAERRLPQDGRVSLQLDGSNSVDLRLVTLPTAQGESVVVRVLDRHSGVINIANLGFQPDTLTRYESAYRRPWGAVLVTGPTGSGKSTTLYATLGELNDPNRSIITVEDPVEYHLNGVKQVQVNRKAGLTFANALRSILRADPDVVLVGEIRDRETATIAVEAALTGHVVLSSLHTNDAASTPARLLEMGVEPFLVTSAVTCILAQRLVRRLCDKCKEPYTPRDDELLAAGWGDIEGSIDGTPEFFRPVGCGSCAKSGFRGRFAVQEVMPMSEEIIGLVLKRGPSDEVRALAVAQGMRPLRQDGLLKVGLGQTTLEELYRVVV